jgi:hypothetical protein
MKRFLTALVIGIVSLGSVSSLAQKVKVELDLKKGDVYQMVVEMENNISQEMMGQVADVKQNMVVTMRTKVLDASTNGGFKIEQSYERMKVEVDVNGQQMSLDSDGDALNPQNAALAKVKEAVIQYDVTPSGEVTNVTGFDELIQSLGSSPQAAGMMKGMMNDDMMVNFFNYLPKEKVGKGDKYSSVVAMPEMMNMEVTTNYIVNEISKEELVLDVDSKIDLNPTEPIVQNGMSVNVKATGTQKGSYVVSREDGMPKSSEIKQEMEMTMSMKNPQNGEDMTIPMTLSSMIKTTVTKQ